MSKLWIPDSCFCELEVNDTFEFINWFNKCEIHKDVTDLSLLLTVLAHNNGFNTRFPNPNAEQKLIMKQDKADERSRIRGLGQGNRKKPNCNLGDHNKS